MGAARNKPRELATLLNLPPRVFALFGLAVGWPAPYDTTTVKPRLPQPAVCHRETYAMTDSLRWVAHYDATAQKFYQDQHMGGAGEWTRRSAKRVATVEALTGRHILHEVLQEHGFGLK